MPVRLSGQMSPLQRAKEEESGWPPSQNSAQYEQVVDS